MKKALLIISMLSIGIVGCKKSEPKSKEVKDLIKSDQQKMDSMKKALKID